MKPKVVVTYNDSFPVDKETIIKKLEGVARVEFIKTPFHMDESFEKTFIDQAINAHAILLRPGNLSKITFQGLPTLKIVSAHGVGVDRFDVDRATSFGIMVTNAPTTNANAVAEMTFGLILCLLRRISWVNQKVCNKKSWDKARYIGDELLGKTISLVGFGSIGRKISKIALSFGMKVIVYDPFIDDSLIFSYGACPVKFIEALSEGDIVSLHLPLTKETQKLIGEREFSLMKDTAYLINTSRGSIIDQKALFVALKKKNISGVALDVLEEEPPRTYPSFFKFQNVIITPHMAGSTKQCLRAVANVTTYDIKNVLSGNRPRYIVNPEVFKNCRAFININKNYIK